MLLLFLGFIGLLLLAGGAVLGLLAWHNLRTSSLLGRPLSRIGKLRPGYRKVRGKAVPLGKALRSPVADKECVYYRLRVYEDQTTYKGILYLPGGQTVSMSPPRLPGGIFTCIFFFGQLGALMYRAHEAAGSDARAVHSSRLLLDEVYDVPLAIKDGTGCVEVDLRGASVSAKEKGRIVSNEIHPLPSKLADHLRKEFDIHAVDDRGRFKTLNIVEETLLTGAKVTVVGAVEPLEDGALCFQKQGGPLVVSERNVAKEGRSAHGRAIGFALGAGAAVGVGLGCFLGAFVLILRARLIR